MGARQTFHLAGAEHKAPIPAGVRIGNLLFSSAINGKDPDTGTYPPDAAGQAKAAFANMAQLVADAGGSTDHIAHVTVFLADRAHREHVDREWLAMFPDPDDRPARHAVETSRPGAGLLQLEIVAVLPDRTEADA